MTEGDLAEAWVERYVRAWTTNDPADIGALFTTDAIYRPTPMSPGWHGRDAIVAKWLARKDAPGIWTFESEVLGVDGDLAVIRGVTTYTAPPGPGTFENLWLVRLDAAGRATAFTEYWMQHPT
ncbi:MAG: nuclear transport factor 2 family protein [Candidatus Limnocylindrales bacterium]